MEILVLYLHDILYYIYCIYIYIYILYIYVYINIYHICVTTKLPTQFQTFIKTLSPQSENY